MAVRKLFCVAVVTMLCTTTGNAQYHESADRAVMYKGKQTATEDTSSLLHAFKEGSIHGHFRYFFMSTLNAPGLTDYFANAAGGGIRYETARFHGFQMAVSGFYIFNIGSSDFTLPDPATGLKNRYEIGLFDMEDPTNLKDMDRLEEFYLRYNFKKSAFYFGRQLINTPFINLQDGRMRPTGVQGMWAEVNDLKNTTLEGGWLYAISPRSTVNWFNVGESIGVFPMGINVDGTPSEYEHNIASSGVAVLGVTNRISGNVKLQGWNVFTQNVFNTAMLQADMNFLREGKSSFFTGAQLIRQDAVNDGGNADATKTYFTKGQKSMSFGARAGWKNSAWEASINYTRITAHGRYLMPREWGRDPFYTFMPRERNEGLGDMHAVMAKVNYNIPKSRVATSLAVGYYKLPDVKNHRLNKYGFPSYSQVNADVRYTFGGALKGFDFQLLVVGKLNHGETHNNDRYIFNKVDMVQYNFVLNYHF